MSPNASKQMQMVATRLALTMAVIAVRTPDGIPHLLAEMFSIAKDR